ncbi:PREDICTED: regulator of nonsense transcripts 3B isoform X1 [Nanorana parkeri]|uniref:regulator of nonsense transcripts 3B isoform X1 n=2 Tax=Nanorana parkeri TaxID=125878 RepID=UPI00085482E8|nr:PREDICTED: regulator of nonsense transcripts 3B isoform X1 [Nanorana parkeri]
MKEDKENTKPKERRAELTGLEDGDKPEKVKEKKEVMSKVVIRRLPPSLTKEQLEEHLQPLPDHDYFEFFANDSSLFPHMYSRAYINFKSQEDIMLFRDRFDGYVFIDHRGQEYPAVVEFAPFQKVAKKKSKKKDSKIGTIEEDPEYKKFLDSYNLDEEKLTSTPETLLEEIEAKNKEMIAKKTTPLLSFLKNRQRLRDEKREERRRRELERKRQREEERRKWKEDERRKRKDTEKQKKYEKTPEKESERSKDEPKIKLLRKPEKDDEHNSEKKFKGKKIEKETVREDRSSAGKRMDGDHGEKGKRCEDEYVKDYRDKDYRDKDYEQERRTRREKEKHHYEEERRKQRDRYEKDRSFRRREDDYRKDREVVRERTRKEAGENQQSTDKSERQSREEKKEDAAKRDRIRNKDRPAMQLYQPGTRSRSRLTQCDDESPAKSSDPSEKKHEGETSDQQKEE